ncbi:MAG: E3 binding domain-containing protein, partial [Acidobacteriota bacterium]|nr:E3 binding domain-containing protein [Acidobacteriota bacterium]
MSEQVFLLPDVGEGLVEAEIVAWKVNVGDVVTLNQPLVDIETAKATVELPSPYAGTVVTLHGNVGDVMEVHKPLITFEVGGVASSATTVAADAPPISTPSVEKREAVLVGYGVTNEEGVATRTRRRQGTSARVIPPTSSAPVAATAPRSTPPVRLYAKQHGLDIATLTGTGRDGLVTRHDVDQALSGAPATSPARVVAVPTGPTSTSRFVGRDLEPWATGPKEERFAVKGVLRSMADAMTQSAFSAPHA